MQYAICNSPRRILYTSFVPCHHEHGRTRAAHTRRAHTTTRSTRSTRITPSPPRTYTRSTQHAERHARPRPCPRRARRRCNYTLCQDTDTLLSSSTESRAACCPLGCLLLIEYVCTMTIAATSSDVTRMLVVHCCWWWWCATSRPLPTAHGTGAAPPNFHAAPLSAPLSVPLSVSRSVSPPLSTRLMHASHALA